MEHTAKMKRICAVLLGGAALLSGSGAVAQTGNAKPQTARPGDLLVEGGRMPAAEAPRSSTCEALVRDPHFAAVLGAANGAGVMGPQIYLPTRLPRNPDYSKPPSVPAGSPLPALGKARFYAPGTTWDPNAAGPDPLAQSTGFSADSSAAELGSTPSMASSSYDEARAACRGMYLRGYEGGVASPGIGFTPNSVTGELMGGFDPAARASATRARLAAARSFIASRDETLPMAFALFDQGRYAESFDWFKKAADKLPFEMGGDEASLFVGKLYLDGLGERSDPQEAVKWLKRAANAPFNPTNQMPVFNPAQPDRNTAIGEAAVILGNLYSVGRNGIPRDFAEARKWYERAYEVGHIPAAKTLGDMYRLGAGVPRDPKKAVAYYQKAAKYGLAAAQVTLAAVLDHGADGVRRDRKKALAWYQAAARSEHPDALYALARAYDLGDGVKADPELALGFYKTAALKGSAPAKNALGTYFHEGKLVPHSEPTARQWFERAAADADTDGMFNLAAMMANGEGGERDLASAYLWLKEAGARGHDKAPVALAAVERQMSPAERAAVSKQ